MRSATFSCLLLVLYSLSTQALPDGRPASQKHNHRFGPPPFASDPRTYPKPGPYLAVDPPVYQPLGRTPGVVEPKKRPQPEQQCGIFGCKPGDITKRITLTKINSSLDDLKNGGLLARRLCRIGLANLNDKVLNNPQFYIHKGVQNTMPAYELPIGRTILLLFESHTCPTGMFCSSTEGVMSYDITGTLQKVALMWQHTWKGDVQYSYKITHQSTPTNEDLFKNMKRYMKRADGVVSTTDDQGVWMETVMYGEVKRSKMIVRMDTSPPTTGMNGTKPLRTSAP